MASDSPLDLARIDPPIWRIMVSDVVYGPYTLGQMRSFVSENRLSLQSQVAMGDGGIFKPASAHPGLAKIFRDKQAPANEAVQLQPANHVIVHKGSPLSRKAILDTLNSFGLFVEVMDGVFLINTDTKTTDLRESLLAECDAEDRILIVNADDSRLAWHGVGDEISAHIHSVWKQ